MPLDPSTVAELAGRLSAAQADHAQIRSLVHDHPTMTLDDAYTVQHAWAEARVAAGARLVGYKVGLTTPSVQRACGIDEPAYGHLFDDMIHADGAALAMDRLFEPRVETELAFVLGRGLSGNVTPGQARAAVDYGVAAVEIVDMRFRLKDAETGAARGTVDTFADNTSSAGVILGERRFAPGEIDTAWAGAVLLRDGVREASGVSGVVLGDPLNSLAWLTGALHRRGQGLKAGQVVMSGSFITPFPAHAGEAFVADFGPLGTISLSFA